MVALPRLTIRAGCEDRSFSEAHWSRALHAPHTRSCAPATTRSRCDSFPMKPTRPRPMVHRRLAQAVTIERRLGHRRLIDCIADNRGLLSTYNLASERTALPRWSDEVAG